MSTHDIKPSPSARIKNRISAEIEENQVRLAYYGGAVIGATSAILVAKYKIGKLEKYIAGTREELNAVYEIAGDAIEFIEGKGLRDEALEYVANLPVTEFTRQLL